MTITHCTAPTPAHAPSIDDSPPTRERFAALPTAYDQASKLTALAVESALDAAEERTPSPDTDRWASAQVDELRQAALAGLRESLRRTESGGGPA